MGPLAHSLKGLVYFDANIVVYAVEGFPHYESAIKSILAAMDDGTLLTATSELTLAEVLVKPKQDENTQLQEAYQQFLEPSSVLHVAPITRSILLQAAEIRASSNLKLPDAIHVATALQLTCATFLTNDRSLRSVPNLPVRILSENLGP